MTVQPKTRAACYVRMSTDMQRFSLLNQADFIEGYAEARNFEIVRTYADPGRSGLSLQGRPALKQLLADVESRSADFDAILVYDVSRWGRFQDPDEAGAYELRCRRAGVQVHYCAELFDNTDPISAAIVKAVKRIMAGEYSRELSVKSHAGLRRQAEAGFFAGGPAPFGFARMVVGIDGVAKGVLQRGQQKAVTSDRIVLVPGPAEEVACVRLLFRTYLKLKKPGLVADLLNRKGMLLRGRPWRNEAVAEILKNELYVGHYTWNRTSAKLGARSVTNPAAERVYVRRAFEGLISQRLFDRVQEFRRARTGRYDRDLMLNQLRRLLRENGRLTSDLIRAAPYCRAPASYGWAFGSIMTAYRLIGYEAPKSATVLDLRPQFEQAARRAALAVQAWIGGGTSLTYRRNGVMFEIRGASLLRLTTVAERANPQGERIWYLLRVKRFFDAPLILLRMSSDGSAVRDYVFASGPVAFVKGVTLHEDMRRAPMWRRYATLEALLEAEVAGTSQGALRSAAFECEHQGQWA